MIQAVLIVFQPLASIDPDGHTEFIVLKIAICGLESMTAKSSTPVTLSPQSYMKIESKFHSLTFIEKFSSAFAAKLNRLTKVVLSFPMLHSHFIMVYFLLYFISTCTRIKTFFV